MKRKILYLLIVLIVCSCTSMQNSETVQMDDGPEQTQVPSTEVILDSVTPTLTSSLNMIGYKQKELSCITYLEVMWGSGPEQWGDPIQLPKQSRNDYPAPAFGVDGHLYMADLPNHRVLVYDGMSSLPVKTIMLSEKFYSDPSVAAPLMPSAMVVTSTGIFIPCGLDKLAMLSLTGEELKDIKLPYPFNPMGPIKQRILIDSRGGLLLTA